MKTYFKNAVRIAAALCLLPAAVLTASLRRQADILAGQAVKLRVRDAVNDLLAPRPASCGSREEAGEEFARLGESMPSLLFAPKRYIII